MKVNGTLENLRLTLGLSEQEWAKCLHFTPQGYQQFKLGKKEVLLATCMELAERFHFSLESLGNGSLDFRSVLAIHSGDTSYVPERYRKAAFSRFQTARVMFDFLEQRYSFPLIAAITRKFQVHPVLFSTEDGWISNLFFTDLYSYLDGLFRLPHDFYFQMGRHSSQVNANTPLGLSYKKLSQVHETYEHLFGDLAPFYELNSDYKIFKISRSQCVVRTRTKKSVAQEIGIKNLGSRSICEWKAGIFSATPNYLGYEDAYTRELQCVHRGDPYCVFDISFGHLTATPPSFLS